MEDLIVEILYLVYLIILFIIIRKLLNMLFRKNHFKNFKIDGVWQAIDGNFLAVPSEVFASTIDFVYITENLIYTIEWGNFHNTDFKCLNKSTFLYDEKERKMFITTSTMGKFILDVKRKLRRKEDVLILKKRKDKISGSIYIKLKRTNLAISNAEKIINVCQ
ncbi:MAG: hypothetical protein P1P64_06935 [Treponemataceae bacterium]